MTDNTSPQLVTKTLQVLSFQYAGLSLNSFNGSIEVEKLDVIGNDTLSALYKAIGCRTVDVAELPLNGVNVSLWVDDEGLFHPHPQASEDTGREVVLGWTITDDNGNQAVLAGNIVFSGLGEEGDTVDSPLSNDSINQLISEGRIKPALLNKLD